MSVSSGFSGNVRDLFVYYYCLKKSYSDSFTCTRHDDPLLIHPNRQLETRLIPVRRWIPEGLHPRVIRYELRKSIDVTITPSDC